MFCQPCLGQAQMAAWILACVPTRGGVGVQHDLGDQAPVFLCLTRILRGSLPTATCLGACPPGPPLPFHMPVGFPACRIAWAPEPEPPESGESISERADFYRLCWATVANVRRLWPEVRGHWGLAFLQGAQPLSCVTLDKSSPLSGFNFLVYKWAICSPSEAQGMQTRRMSSTVPESE